LWAPAFGLVTVNVLAPFVSGCETGVPLSTVSVTFPVGVPPDELTVTVTLPFALYVTPGALTAVVVDAAFTINVPDAVLPVKFPEGV
jgi:hypothetical protein